MVKELSADQVRKKCDPSLFKCSSTEELKPQESIIGQDRALSALKFGLNIMKPGFNIYVSGLAGTGRTTAIKAFLEALAARKEPPPDWCYVYNFHDSYYPQALKLPTGMGQTLQKDMKSLIESAGRSLTQAFSSKEYTDRRSEITESFNKQRDEAFSHLNQKAGEGGFLLQTTHVGLIFVPTRKGEPIKEEEYQGLSSKEKEDLRKDFTPE